MKKQKNRQIEEAIPNQIPARCLVLCLKDFFKYESAIMKENGKVGLKYSCLICLPVKKVLITNKNPIRYLGNHMKSIHPQLLARFDEVTQAGVHEICSDFRILHISVSREIFNFLLWQLFISFSGFTF